MGSVDCGEDDPVGEEAAGNVVEICPAGAELVAFDSEILAEAIMDFAGGFGSWVLGALIEPVPVAHNLVSGLLGHAEVSGALHVWEPYVLEVLVSESHGVEPDIEVEEENAVNFGCAVVSRCV